MCDFVFEEFNQVAGDGARGVVFGGVFGGLVRVVGFDDGDDALGVDGDGGCADAVGGGGYEVGLGDC